MIWSEIDGRAAASTAIRCSAGCLGHAAQQERNLAKLEENDVTVRRRAAIVLALSLMAWVVCEQIAPAAAARPACVQQRIENRTNKFAIAIQLMHELIWRSSRWTSRLSDFP
jgi:hypothetical protein